MCIVGGQIPISIRMNNKDSIQKNTLQISEKIRLFSLEKRKRKKESSGMYILVYGIAQQEGVELL